MPELVVDFIVADRIGSVVAFVAIVALFAIVKHSERLRPGRKGSDD